MITLGIDIGSTTSKCVLLKDGQEIIAASLRVGGLGTEGPAEALAELWEKSGLTADNVDRTIVTGYGRNKYEGADGEVSELTCHALGGRWVFPGLIVNNPFFIQEFHETHLIFITMKVSNIRRLREGYKSFLYPHRVSEASIPS